MRVSEEKVKKKSYQIDNNLKKSENFTLGVHYTDKHYGVYSTSVYTYF